MVGPVFNAVVVRRATEARFAASSAALPTSFAEALAAERLRSALPSRALAAQATATRGGTASGSTRTPRAPILDLPSGFPAAAAPWLRTSARRDLASAIHSSASQAGVDPNVALAVAIAESSLEPTAKSSDGLSEGTFQVTRATAAQIERHFARGVVDRPPGDDDVALGVAYLRYLDDLFARGGRLARGVEATSVADADERTRFAVAAFNAGEGRVAAAQKRAAEQGLDASSFSAVRPFLPAITRQYVGRVSEYAGRDERTARTA